MGTRFTRLYKLDWLKEKVNIAAGLGKVVNKEELVAQFISLFGSTRKTALELLKTLELTKKIAIEFGEIWTYDKFQEQKTLEKADQEADEILEDISK